MEIPTQHAPDGSYISPSGREALRRYQYRGRDMSLIYAHVLTPMNNILIEWIPLWMAPNVVTLSGVAVGGLAYLVLAAYCPMLRCDSTPAWVYILDAFCSFAYQVCRLIMANKNE